MQHKKIDVLVGGFVLLGAAALVGLALRVGGGDVFAGKSTYSVTANFKNVGALKVRAPVKLAGVPIGSVSDIELVQLEGGEHKAKVTFTIVDSVTIPSDSGAAIVTAGLLGTQFINIQEGPSIDNLLKPNGVIEDTQEAMILEDLIKAFGINKAEEASKTDGAAAK